MHISPSEQLSEILAGTGDSRNLNLIYRTFRLAATAFLSHFQFARPPKCTFFISPSRIQFDHSIAAAATNYDIEIMISGIVAVA